MSFALTTEQMLARTKTVTRRLGWRSLKPGTLLQAVEKAMGLGKGGNVRRLGVIRVLSVRRERLDEMVGTEYGDAEAVREGYPEHSGEQFAEMFAQRLAVVRECRPAWVFAENVSLDAFREPWRDLRGMGYRVPPALRLSARDVVAPHRRERWLLLAHADGCGLKGERGPGQEHRERWEGARGNEPDGCGSHVANPDRARLAQWQGEQRDAWQELAAPQRAGRWPAEPQVGRVAHGIPIRVDRLRGLGNAQVPIQAAQAFRILMEMHYQ